jgi:peptidoglycan/LPS O-acetylase OafA/YrhL
MRGDTMTRPNLDLLRSMAIVLVVVDHTLLAKGILHWGSWSVADIGVFGVYLFFVHTSLVLMWSLERRPNALDFYIRRAFRIYPLAIVVILFVAAAHAPVGGTPEHFFQASSWTPKTLLLNCLLLQDGSGNRQMIDTVMWSLPPEIYMYILLPGLFFYARGVRRLWPLLLVWGLVLLVDGRTFGVSNRGNGFPMLVPDFLAGVVAYVGYMRRRTLLPFWVLPPLLAGLFAFVMTMTRFRADWCACMAVGLLLPLIAEMRGAVLMKVVQQVAKYSYGIYLTHNLGIVVGMHVLEGKPFAVQLAAELATTAIGAYAAYHLIENPMIHLGARVAARLAQERGLPSEKSLETLEPAP